MNFKRLATLIAWYTRINYFIYLRINLGGLRSNLPGWEWNLDTKRGDGLENIGGGGMGPMSFTDIGGSGRTERSISPSFEGTSSTSGRFNRETLCITGTAVKNKKKL